MISIQFGKIAAIRPPRVSVQLFGAFGDCVLEDCLIVTLGGQSPALRVWSPGSVGDVVAVLFDDDRPESSIVLGGVYGDRSALPDTTKSGLSVEGGVLSFDFSGASAVVAPSLTLGASTTGTSYAVRDDKMSSELAAIRQQFYAMAEAFNLHVHAVTGATTGGPEPLMSVPYYPGSVACSSVLIK